jgi:poly-gamma-glutamate capsule biosynthesis protein CapA/YwtB (metallophosphatase superfamily)
MITEQDIEVVADAIRKACDFAADDKEGEYFGFYSARIDAVAQTAAQSIVPILVERCAGAVRACNDEVRYHEPTDWAYGAQDALNVAEKAVRSLASCGGGAT